MVVPTAFVAPAPFAAVRVTGDDRTSFLHNVLTQDLLAASPGEVVGALYLDAHGSPLAVGDVVVREDDLVLVTPDAEVARGLATGLGGRTFLADVRFEVLDATAVALRGDGAGGVAEAVGVEAEPGRWREVDRVLVLGRQAGTDLVGERGAVSGLRDRLAAAGAVQEDGDALEAWRVAHGEPRWGHEIRPPHLPEEMGLLPTHVHLKKGCYPGQEAVARMWMLGRPRRRLARVILHGDADAGWQAGSGRDAVEVTSATSWDDERVGLAYVPPRASPGDRFDGEHGAIVVRDIVGADREVPGHDPDVRRRRDSRAPRAT